jgi:hypothetical protein
MFLSFRDSVSILGQKVQQTKLRKLCSAEHCSFATSCFVFGRDSVKVLAMICFLDYIFSLVSPHEYISYNVT